MAMGLVGGARGMSPVNSFSDDAAVRRHKVGALLCAAFARALRGKSGIETSSRRITLNK